MATHDSDDLKTNLNKLKYAIEHRRTRALSALQEFKEDCEKVNPDLYECGIKEAVKMVEKNNTMPVEESVFRAIICGTYSTNCEHCKNKSISEYKG